MRSRAERRIRKRLRRLNVAYIKPKSRRGMSIVTHIILIFLMIFTGVWMWLITGWNGWYFMGGVIAPMIVWFASFMGGKMVEHFVEETPKIVAGRYGIFTAKDYHMGAEVYSFKLKADDKDIIKWAEEHGKDPDDVDNERVIHLEFTHCNGVSSFPIYNKGLVIVTQAGIRLTPKEVGELSRLAGEGGGAAPMPGTARVSGEMLGRNVCVFRQHFRPYVLGAMRGGILDDIRRTIKEIFTEKSLLGEAPVKDWCYVLFAHDVLPPGSSIPIPEPTNIHYDMWNLRARNKELEDMNIDLRTTRARDASIGWDEAAAGYQAEDDDRSKIFGRRKGRY